MLNDIQITSDYMSRWVVLKRRVGAVKSQRVLNVLFYVNILQCFFVVKNFTANAIGDNGNKLIFEIWWNFFYDLFSIKNVADVNSIDSFVSKRNMEEIVLKLIIATLNLGRHIFFYIENYIVKNILRGVTEPDILLSIFTSMHSKFESVYMQTLNTIYQYQLQKFNNISNEQYKKRRLSTQESAKMQTNWFIYF
jgi:hypothetical protein